MPRELTDCRTAIRLALERVQHSGVDTSWSDAGSLRTPEWAAPGDAPYAGGTVFRSAYGIRLAGCPEELWDGVTAIGGDQGWYGHDLLWACADSWTSWWAAWACGAGAGTPRVWPWATRWTSGACSTCSPPSGWCCWRK
jgi:hypothetical protein